MKLSRTNDFWHTTISIVETIAKFALASKWIFLFETLTRPSLSLVNFQQAACNPTFIFQSRNINFFSSCSALSDYLDLRARCLTQLRSEREKAENGNLLIFLRMHNGETMFWSLRFGCVLRSRREFLSISVVEPKKRRQDNETQLPLYSLFKSSLRSVFIMLLAFFRCRVALGKVTQDNKLCECSFDNDRSLRLKT